MDCQMQLADNLSYRYLLHFMLMLIGLLWAPIMAEVRVNIIFLARHRYGSWK
jgi:hypothetical protein